MKEKVCEKGRHSVCIRESVFGIACVCVCVCVCVRERERERERQKVRVRESVS